MLETKKGEETLGKAAWEIKDRAALTGDAGLAQSLVSLYCSPHIWDLSRRLRMLKVLIRGQCVEHSEKVVVRTESTSLQIILEATPVGLKN